MVRNAFCSFQDTSHLCPQNSLDNSEAMRNGDYPPNRLEAMIEAVNEIASAKIASNAETTVGILSMGGCRCVLFCFSDRSREAVSTQLADLALQGGGSSVTDA